ncbi:MAG: acetyl-CoA carboxylase biotin carboxyl carrier protein subunit [Alphaproteobacteria bacterium]|jgi:acetyl-CoA carboxylase biotin carboxyl carrier protein
MSDPFDIDADLVRKLADLLGETGLGEIEFEDGGKRIRVAMPGAGPIAATAAAPTAAAAPEATAAAPADDSTHPGALNSPMVGTVYLAQTPGDPPLVNVGDSVKEGQTVLLIEAMKTFNEVKSPRAGTVSRIAITNGQPVEYDELLLIVE